MGKGGLQNSAVVAVVVVVPVVAVFFSFLIPHSFSSALLVLVLLTLGSSNMGVYWGGWCLVARRGRLMDDVHAMPCTKRHCPMIVYFLE